MDAAVPMLAFDAHLDLSMNALLWNRDLTRPVAPLRRAAAAIFHDTTHSPTAEHDAALLYHYIVNAKNILENSPLLRRKLRAAGLPPA